MIDKPGPRILVRPLEWGIYDHTLNIYDELGPRRLTHIICSDLVSFLDKFREEGRINRFSFLINRLAKVYFPHLLAPLLRTLIHLTSLPPSSPQPIIIISYRIRSLPKEIPFWSAFGLWFSYEPVLYRRYRPSPLASLREDEDPGGDRPPLNVHSNGGPEARWARYHTPSSTYVFIARRKTVSLGWSVSGDDNDLLGGVGAYGNQRQKGDDTFELMLLMDLLDGED